MGALLGENSLLASQILTSAAPPLSRERHFRLHRVHSVTPDAAAVRRNVRRPGGDHRRMDWCRYPQHRCSGQLVFLQDRPHSRRRSPQRASPPSLLDPDSVAGEPRFPFCLARRSCVRPDARLLHARPAPAQLNCYAVSPNFAPPPPANALTPLAAFSTRRVVAAYAGPAVSVRHGTNGSVADFYPWTEPTGATGLATGWGVSYPEWIGAATGFVATWCANSLARRPCRAAAGNRFLPPAWGGASALRACCKALQKCLL